MKLGRLLLFPCALFLCIGCGSNSADKDLLQGSWYQVAEQFDGKNLSVARIDATAGKLIFQGEKYAFRSGRDTIEQGTFTVDPSKTPKTIDFISKSSGLSEGGSRLGIYDLQENGLKVCIAELNKERPTEFATTVGSGLELKTYKRVPK